MGALPGASAAPFALVAFLEPSHLHLLGDAKHGFLELEGEIFAQIGAALGARTAGVRPVRRTYRQN